MKIITLNCNSLVSLARRHELSVLIEKHQPHIVCLNETKLKASHKLHINNFKIYRTNPKTDRSGGTAILVREEIKHTSPKAIVEENYTATSLTIGEGRNSIVIHSIYFWKVTKADLKTLFNQRSRVLLCGDFNAKHHYWNPTKENSNGKQLHSFCAENEVQIYFPSSGTRGESVIDLAIAKNISIQNISTLNEFCSDHLPVKIKLEGNYNIEQTISHRGIPDYGNADWEGYRQFMHLKLDEFDNKPIESSKEIETRVTMLAQLIRLAEDKYVPSIDPAANSRQLPPNILKMIKIRNYYRNMNRKIPALFSPTLINRTTKSIQDNIKQHFQAVFRKKLSDIRPDKTNLFNYIRRIKPNSGGQIVLEEEGKQIIDPTIITNKIADHYEAVFQGTSHIISENNNQETDPDPIVNSVDDFMMRQSLPYDIGEISTDYEEVRKLADGLKNKKSPGVDGVTNRAIKNLPLSGFRQMVLIINAILKFAYFPETWKTAKVIAIPKSSKLCSPENTRPISLLSGLSKIAERIVARRLLDAIHPLIPEEQFGFVHNRSTTDALMRLVNHIKSAKRLHKTVAAVFLDMQKAFDSVWHDGLVHKLIVSGVPPALVTLIKSYLEKRRFFVDIENRYKSTTREAAAGVPQGSVLGPLLYIFYIHDIPKPTSDGTKLQIFADDTTVFCTNRSGFQCTNRIQNYLNSLNEYYKRWRININATKTQMVLFYPKKGYKNQWKPAGEVQINSQKINTTKSVKYLGLHMANGLDFSTHVKNIQKQCFIAFNILYPILNFNSGLDATNKLLVYKMYIRPIITYAAPAWYDLISKTQQATLQKIQNRALRFVFNSWPRPPDFKQCSTRQLHDSAGLLYVDEFSAGLLERRISNLLLSPSEMINEIAHQC